MLERGARGSPYIMTRALYAALFMRGPPYGHDKWVWEV